MKNFTLFITGTIDAAGDTVEAIEAGTREKVGDLTEQGKECRNGIEIYGGVVTAAVLTVEARPGHHGATERIPLEAPSVPVAVPVVTVAEPANGALTPAE